MNFYAQQEAARRRTAGLVALAALFAVLVVAATGALLSLAAWGAWAVLAKEAEPFGAFAAAYPAVVPLCGVAACVIVLGAGFAAYARVASGEAVMRHVGARRATPRTDPTLLNVAEEMALASGADMPSVWVLEADAGVNAFAAGFGEGDAAMCVTAGALRFLTRDELQGVVAHEFGHVLNGDMRLNTRLVTLVEALGGITAMGRTMLKPFARLFGPRDESASSVHLPQPRGRYGGNLGAVPTLLLLVYLALGVSLWVVGLAGALFARLLQRAVSRAREFAADAAAVQFTRNPEGLADALRFTRLLGAYQWRHPGAEAANVCHMFFVGEAWGGGRGTHPSVASRVARLSPRGLATGDAAFRRRLEDVRRDRAARVRLNHERYQRRQAITRQLAPQAVVIPPALNARLLTVGGAGGVLCALLRGEALAEWPGEMSAAARRRVVQRAVASIQTRGTQAEAAAWADRVEGLAGEAGALGSFAFFVWCAVRRRLRRQPPRLPCRPAALTREAERVVATVAALGANPAAAYALARKRLVAFFPALPRDGSATDGVRDLADALDRLSGLAAPVKRKLLVALREVIAEDGVVTDDESNHLAAIADALAANGWDI